jgi:hypothetical protein
MAQDTGRRSTRKQALQDRSQAMVDAILDGAVSAFMSVAAPVYDADAETKSPSVNRIAKIAGVSIGSLYQYFPGEEGDRCGARPATHEADPRAAFRGSRAVVRPLTRRSCGTVRRLHAADEGHEHR